MPLMGLKMKCCLKNVEVQAMAMGRMILEDSATAESLYCITILLSNYLWILVLDGGLLNFASQFLVQLMVCQIW
jgi:hypothetical protein